MDYSTAPVCAELGDFCTATCDLIEKFFLEKSTVTIKNIFFPIKLSLHSGALYEHRQIRSYPAFQPAGILPAPALPPFILIRWNSGSMQKQDQLAEPRKKVLHRLWMKQIPVFNPLSKACQPAGSVRQPGSRQELSFNP